MTAHALLSASSSHRWLVCPGSVEASREVEQRRSAAADEGTTAHALAEMVLLDTRGVCADQFVGQTCDETGLPYTSEMARYVQEYVDYVRALKGLPMIEARLDLRRWVPEGFGTSDAVVIAGDTLHVVDLKYGKGIPVHAEENTQGMLYALGAFDLVEGIADIRRVVIHIHQPRLDLITTWEISAGELLKRGKWIAERAKLAMQPDAPRVPDEKACQWCSAKAACPALLKLTQDTLMSDFEALPCPDEFDRPDTLSPERLAKVMAWRKLIISWLDAVEDRALEMATGDGFPGYKLVAGRSTRAWADPEAAEVALIAELGDDAYEHTLLSVAKAEKMLGKKRADVIAPLVVKSAGRPTLVPDSDPREAIGACLDEFKNLANGD